MKNKPWNIILGNIYSRCRFCYNIAAIFAKWENGNHLFCQSLLPSWPSLSIYKSKIWSRPDGICGILYFKFNRIDAINIFTKFEIIQCLNIIYKWKMKLFKDNVSCFSFWRQSHKTVGTFQQEEGTQLVP